MNLINYYNSNIQSIYNVVTDLYKRGQVAYESDVNIPKLKLVPVPQPSKKLNRAVYLWTLECIRQLEAVINDLVAVYNDSGIIDYNIGDTPNINLWLPKRLVIDDLYIAKLSDNFEKCKKLLDQLNKNLQPFLVGM